jgi:hypothetical protein
MDGTTKLQSHNTVMQIYPYPTPYLHREVLENRRYGALISHKRNNYALK